MAVSLLLRVGTEVVVVVSAKRTDLVRLSGAVARSDGDAVVVVVVLSSLDDFLFSNALL